MIQVQTKVSKGFQLTLPSAIRKAMGIEADSPVMLTYNDGTLAVKRLETQEENIRRVIAQLDTWRNSLPREVTTNIKNHAGWTANQYHDHYDNTPENKTYLKEKYHVNA